MDSLRQSCTGFCSEVWTNLTPNSCHFDKTASNKPVLYDVVYYIDGGLYYIFITQTNA